MKKAFVIILFTVCAWMIVGAIDNSSADVTPLITASVWKFKSVYSQNPSTVQYMTPLFDGTTFQFDPDGTYSGKFFEKVSHGTWEISEKQLVLNKGTFKEESYTFSIPSGDKLMLETTEQGDKVLLEFVK